MSSLNPLKTSPKAWLPAAVLAAAIIGLVVHDVTLQSHLSSSTRITQNLRQELESIRNENKIYKEHDDKKISEINTLNEQLNHLQQDKNAFLGKQDELQKLVKQAEATLEAQNRKIAVLENTLKDAEEKIRRQKKASANLEQQTRSAKSNPGMTQEYVRLVEGEWMAAMAKTEDLTKDLDKTLADLSSFNQERSKLRRETATMHYNLAVILTEQGNYKAAIQEYEKVLESRPEDADAHYNLGILYDDILKNSEKALAHYKKYVQFSPQSPEANKVKRWIQDKELDTAMKFKI